MVVFYKMDKIPGFRVKDFLRSSQTIILQLTFISRMSGINKL